MDAAGWEDVKEEICTQLEIGTSQGETELETMTRFVWLERQKNLDAIENAVAAALAREHGPITSKAKVLQWKPPLRSHGPSQAIVNGPAKKLEVDESYLEKLAAKVKKDLG